MQCFSFGDLLGAVSRGIVGICKDLFSLPTVMVSQTPGL